MIFRFSPGHFAPSRCSSPSRLVLLRLQLIASFAFILAVSLFTPNKIQAQKAAVTYGAAEPMASFTDAPRYIASSRISQSSLQVVTRNITVYLNSEGQAGIAPGDIDGGSSGGIAPLSLSLDRTSFSCHNAGENIVTLTVTDANGNTATGQATVTVVDPSPDSDGDGLGDLCDMDDDNDGIADEEECSRTTFFWSDPPVIQPAGSSRGTAAIGSINGVGYTFISDQPFGLTDRLFGSHQFPDSYNVPNQSTIRNENASKNTIIFEEPIRNPLLVFASIGDPRRPVTIQFYDDFEVLHQRNFEPGKPNIAVDKTARTITASEGFVIVRLEGVLEEVRFDYNAFENYVNFVFGAGIFGPCDYDGDGITNNLDLDSDNDGCFDAVEGSALLKLDAIDSEGRLLSAVDDNGIPVVAQGGQQYGASLGASANCFCENQLDTTDPVLSLNGELVLVLDQGTEYAEQGAQVADECTAPLIIGGDAVDTNTAGTYTVTYNATDNSGNSAAQIIRTVQVIDNVKPALVVKDLVVNNQPGLCGAVVTDFQVSATDASGIADVSFNLAEGSFFNVGTTEITALATDNEGNTAQAFFSVTVRDEEGPVFTSKETLTLLLDENGVASLDPTQYDLATISDNCGVDRLEFSRIEFDRDDVGLQVVNVTAYDVHGNANTTQAEVQVRDVTEPIVLTRDIQLSLNEEGIVSIAPSDIDAGTRDNCSFTLSLDRTSFDCTDKGMQVVTLTATDPSGNTASAQANVIIDDNTQPIIDNQMLEVQLDNNGMGMLSEAEVKSLVRDNCGISQVSFDQIQFTADHLGTKQISVTATDDSGNKAEATLTVNVVDNVPPVVVTEDISLSLDENGQAVITPDDVLILSEEELAGAEACAVSAAERHALWLSKYIAKRGQGNNTARKRGRNRHKKARNTRFVFDASGGSLSRHTDGTATVRGTVRSTANPEDRWIIDLKLENARDWEAWSALGRSYKDEKRLAKKHYTDWTYYEMAPGSKLVGDGINKGEEIPLSHAPANYRYGFQLGEAANSKNGNFGLSGWFFYTNRKGKLVQGDFNLDVTDCAQNTVAPEALVTSDNCNLGEISLSQSTFSCADIGKNVVTITVADASGNEAMAEAIVTITDDTAPVTKARNITVSLGADGTVTIDPQSLDAGSTDNCGIVSYSLSRDIFTCRDVSNRGFFWWWRKWPQRGKKVTLTVTDAAGNSASADAYVTVVDNTPPVISAEPITLVVYRGRSQFLTWPDVTSRVTDNCRLMWVKFPRRRFGTQDAGQHTVPVRAWDLAGNSAIGTIQVNVIDISDMGRRVTICYKGKTRRVHRVSVQHWLRKGASLGACTTDFTMAPAMSNLADAMETHNEPLVELAAYPNPTHSTNTITFSSERAGLASLAVVNTSGVAVTQLFTGHIEAHKNVEVTYDTRELPEGVYILRLVTAGEMKTLKLLVKE